MSSLLVLFHSQEHGNTAAMAEAVAEGAGEKGAEVTLVNTNETRFAPDRYRGFDGVAFMNRKGRAGQRRIGLAGGEAAAAAERPDIPAGRAEPR